VNAETESAQSRQSGSGHDVTLRLLPQRLTVTATVGENFALDLEAKAGQGYEWMPIRDFLGVSYLGRETHGAAPSELAHPDTQRLWFRALEIGQFEVRLLYKRRWEVTIHRELLLLVHVEAEPSAG
jgi:predicted secreted protein